MSEMSLLDAAVFALRILKNLDDDDGDARLAERELEKAIDAHIAYDPNRCPTKYIGLIGED